MFHARLLESDDEAQRQQARNMQRRIGVLRKRKPLVDKLLASLEKEGH